MSGKWVLALDMGTSSTRAIVYDENLAEVPDLKSQVPYGMRTTPDGGLQGDPGLLFSAVVQTIDEVLARAEDKVSRIRAVGCSCFWHSLMGVDRHNTPLTPVYTWADTRSRGEADRLREELDIRKVHELTGCFIHPSYWPPKLRWLRTRNAELFRRVDRFVSFGEYVYRCFFDDAGVSLSMASATGLLNRHTLDWEPSMLEATGVEPERLGRLIDLDEPSRGLREEWAERWPALREIPWVPPAGDGALSNLGAGATDEETVAVVMGTSGAARVMFEGGDGGEVPWGLFCYRLDRRRGVIGGAISNAGNVIRWMHDTLKLGSLEAVEKELEANPPKNHGLKVVPSFAGERSLAWDDRATASIEGLTLDTKAIEIYAATLEAMVDRFHEIMGALKVRFPGLKRMALGGGVIGHSPYIARRLGWGGGLVTENVRAELSSIGAARAALAILG